MCAKMFWVFAVLAIFSLVACSSVHSGPVSDDLSNDPVGGLDLPNGEEELNDLVRDLELSSEEEETINDEQTLSNAGDKDDKKRVLSLLTRLITVFGNVVGEKVFKLGETTAEYYILHHNRCMAEKCEWEPTTFDHYPCHTFSKFNYGCGKNGYCWSGCTTTQVPYEWCWVKSRSTTGWMTCTGHEDCKNGALCEKAYCSGGCTI